MFGSAMCAGARCWYIKVKLYVPSDLDRLHELWVRILAGGPDHFAAFVGGRYLMPAACLKALIPSAQLSNSTVWQ